MKLSIELLDILSRTEGINKEIGYNANIRYAIVGPEHMGAQHLIAEIYSRNVDIIIVLESQKSVEINSGNLEELLKNFPREKIPIIPIEQMKIENFRLEAVEMEEIYIREEKIKNYINSKNIELHNNKPIKKYTAPKYNRQKH